MVRSPFSIMRVIQCVIANLPFLTDRPPYTYLEKKLSITWEPTLSARHLHAKIHTAPAVRAMVNNSKKRGEQSLSKSPPVVFFVLNLEVETCTKGPRLSGLFQILIFNLGEFGKAEHLLQRPVLYASGVLVPLLFFIRRLILISDFFVNQIGAQAKIKEILST